MNILFSCTTYSPEFRCHPLTLLCYAINPETGTKIKCRLVYDNCSNLTVIKRSLSQALGLRGQVCDVPFAGTGGSVQRYNNERDVRFVLASLSGDFVTEEIQAVTMPTVTHGLERIMIDPSQYDHLREVTGELTEPLPMPRRHFAKFNEVEILLGSPYESYYGCQRKTLGQTLSQPVAVHTKLGLCISASADLTSPLGSHHTVVEDRNFHINGNGDVLLTSSDDLPDLTHFFRLDVIGIKEHPEDDDGLTYEEHKAEEIIKNNMTYDNIEKHYTTVLPWKSIKIEETNLERARATAHAFVRKYQQSDPPVIEGWIKACKEMVDFGFVEKVPDEDLRKSSGFHIIQTFPVKQVNKPEHSIRLVFAANQKMAKSKMSLNDHLYTGPCTLADLVSLVLRFRMYPYVLNLDISRMFHRTKVHHTDREFLRFFLIKRDASGKIVFEQYRANSVCFGLTCSPMICNFLLRAHAEKFKEKKGFECAAQQILNNSYVDDILVMNHHKENLADTAKKVKFILDEASLPSYKYVSNYPPALAQFPVEHISPKTEVSVLGTRWTPNKDVLTFNWKKSPIKNLVPETTEAENDDSLSLVPNNQKKCLTKRILLSTIAKVFDSQGLISPFLLIPKILMQKTWRANLDWDTQLPPQLHKEFEEFLEELPKLNDISVPRCLLNSESSKIKEVCCFADASEDAYACVCYVVAEDEEGNRKVSLVFSKTRMRPLGKDNKTLSKELSICRLELLACQIAARAANYVRNAYFDVEDIRLRLFSDSQVTLARLQNNYESYRVFVANRLKSIKQCTRIEDWFYVPTEQNFGADIASRGRTLSEFIDSPLWWSGPNFLSDPDHNYEAMRITNIHLSKENRDLENGEKKVTNSHFSQVTFHYKDTIFNNQLKFLDPMKKEAVDEDLIEFYMRIDSEHPKNGGLLRRFHSWDLLVRVVARILQFVAAIKKGWSKLVSFKPKSLSGPITRSQGKKKKSLKEDRIPLDEYNEAERFLFRLSQYFEFAEEVWILKSGGKLGKSNRLYKKRPFWDSQDCLIRMAGRAPSSNLIILPKKCRISELYVKYVHVTNNHAGTNVLASRVEKRCYLLGGKNEYKRITQCCACRPPKQLFQVMADLPPIRCNTSTQSFRYVAFDYSGPYYHYSSPGKNEKKCWCLIVSCLVTRYVHVELVEDCTTESLIRAIRAYVSLFGAFSICFSDNASYFRAADRELEEVLRRIKWVEVENEVYKLCHAQWKFFTPMASSTAGVIEACVKLFKVALKKALDFTYRLAKTPRYFSYQEFRVVCLEIASLVNDRPLAVVSYDKEGLSDECNITPNLLVRGRSGGPLEDDVQFKNITSNSHFNINKVYKDRSAVMRLFWNEFMAKYHRQLKFTPKWFQKLSSPPPLDSYVLLKEKMVKHQKASKPGTYVTGRIVAVNRRADGLVGSVDLVTTKNKNIITRDIRSLSMLEHDFLLLTENNHQCLLQDTKIKDDRTVHQYQKCVVPVPITSSLHTWVLEDQGLQPAASPPKKRGPEAMFSMATFIPKPAGYWEKLREQRRKDKRKARSRSK